MRKYIWIVTWPFAALWALVYILSHRSHKRMHDHEVCKIIPKRTREHD